MLSSTQSRPKPEPAQGPGSGSAGDPTTTFAGDRHNQSVLGGAR
jgi:hypothetical protein